jgi:uncharacterized membrane protein YedE/YeeE
VTGIQETSNMQPAATLRADHNLVAPVLLAIAALGAVLLHDVSVRQAVLFLIGTGLGMSLFHAAFGFAGGWRRFLQQHRSAAIRAQLLLLAIVSVSFFPVLAGLLPGVSVNGAYAPAGVSVLVGAFLFGAGMQLGGGCGSGTLYSVGGGHVRMLITLTFFVIGTVIGSVHLPWWLALPSLGQVSLLERFGWLPALVLQLAVLAALYLLVRRIEYRRKSDIEPIALAQQQRSFSERLLFGPWPLVWGALGLGLLSLATLMIAGYPWSITFAFGLWGTKIWSALGGDISTWSYWSSGYPAWALEHSVLADTTSIMDFGIILGAILAAGLAGRFAPAAALRLRDVTSAVIGGLLLGYGARLAFGCNIGGLLGGIASGSLHGWLWLLAGFTGTIIGVKLRSLMQLDPPRRKSV